jgi:dUTP pyrophosphatase
MPHILRIKVLNPERHHKLLEYYIELSSKNAEREDAGIDLPFPEDTVIPANQTTLHKLGVACEFHFNGNEHSSAFYLYPRSSIGRTPLTMANNVGIIDAGYRGELGAMIRCNYDERFPDLLYSNSYTAKAMERLFQVTAPDLGVIHVEVLLDDEQLSSTKRGEKGFGSTGL